MPLAVADGPSGRDLRLPAAQLVAVWKQTVSMSSRPNGSATAWTSCTGAPENKVSVVKAEADEVLTFAPLSHFLQVKVFRCV